MPTEHVISSIANNVKSQIFHFESGRIFTPTCLNINGSHQAVLHALSRLTKKGVIKRVYRGLYYKPELSTLFSGRDLPPDPYQIISVLTHANNENIQIHGGHALNRLGISNQVPMIYVYYTNGRSREIRIGGLRVKFVHSSYKPLFETSDPKVATSVSAMYFLGKNLVNEDVIQCIRLFLTGNQFEDLKNLELNKWMKSALNSSTKPCLNPL